jgi:2-methylcitrate dehydratase PrpD
VTAGRTRTSLGDAVTCAVLDLDDVHWPTGTHPGSMIWPSVIGESDWPPQPADPAELRAAIVGYEVMIRFAQSFGPAHRRVWHPTSTAGVLGASAAAALAAGMDFDDVVTCVSHASSLACGLMQGLVEHADTGLVHRLHARVTALACVASVELRAPAAGVDGPQGLLSAFGGEVEPLLASADTPAIAETTFRLEPASGLLQGLASTARTTRDGDARGGVRVGLPESAIALSDRSSPTSAHDRWWSAQWTTAACLLGVERLAMLDGLSTPEVDALSARIVLESADQPFLALGERVHAIDMRHDATDPELIGKWRWLNPHAPTPTWLSSDDTTDG